MVPHVPQEEPFRSMRARSFLSLDDLSVVRRGGASGAGGGVGGGRSSFFNSSLSLFDDFLLDFLFADGISGAMSSIGKLPGTSVTDVDFCDLDDNFLMSESLLLEDDFDLFEGVGELGFVMFMGVSCVGASSSLPGSKALRRSGILLPTAFRAVEGEVATFEEFDALT